MIVDVRSDCDLSKVVAINVLHAIIFSNKKFDPGFGQMNLGG